MQLIQDPTAVATLPALPALSGPVGYFTEGVVGSQAPTDIRGWWLNLLGIELVTVIEAAEITPSAVVTDQLLQAIKYFIASTTRGTTVFATDTSGSFVVPANTYFLNVKIVAGGGGGGCGNASYMQSGGGGGAGGFGCGVAAVQPGQVIPYTIGAGGAGGIFNGLGALPGGVSSLGAFVSCTGGNAGNQASGLSNTFAYGGLGGVASYGTGFSGFDSPGGDGTDGTAMPLIITGNGGASFFGGGGRAGVNGGMAGRAWGAGGGAGYDASCNGAAGAPGILILEY